MSFPMHEAVSGPSSSPNGHPSEKSRPLPGEENDAEIASKPRVQNYRSTEGFSSEAVAHSTAAKLKLESFYKVAVSAAIERKAR
jgi:protein-serine/threonine kinase